MNTQALIDLIYEERYTVLTVPDEDIKFLEDIMVNIAFIQTNEQTRKLMGETLNEAYTEYKSRVEQ